MPDPRQTTIPTLVRVKPGALDRLGIYCGRAGFRSAAFFFSTGLVPSLLSRAVASLTAGGVRMHRPVAVESNDFASAVELFKKLPASTDVIVGVGGGKALDVAKYVAFLAGRPFLAVPTSLSNDGFCSPQSSLAIDGRRRSMPSAVPFGVVIDTAVCFDAPQILWLSGIGDLVSKFTAVADWKLAFHAQGVPVDDFAALLSDASVHQFLSHSMHDLEGMRLLGAALLLNGVAMSICGSSRPASGSEHLISHALDRLSAAPHLHGLQVGVATYLVSRLQGGNHGLIARAFERTGFWSAIARDPFDRAEWLAAVKAAPSVKPGYYTVLSSRDCLPEVEELLSGDPLLAACFR